MAFLTLFTAPKPFTHPHIAAIQRNAIQSWLQLGDQAEVLLVGQESGMAGVAGALGVKHLPNVARNDQGTPLVSSIFELARQSSDSPLLAYINADILIFPDFIEAARQIDSQADRFLVVGQRWDLEVTQPLEFAAGWEERLRQQVRTSGKLHLPAGSDYFIFPRSLFTEMPAFAIGRAGWDNWMIYHARAQGWPVVDATRDLMVVHQNHDYSHLPGGKPHYDLEETHQNIALAGGAGHIYTLLDSDRQLVGGKIRLPRPTLLRILRWAEVRLAPKNGRPGTRKALSRQFRRLRRRLTGSL